MITIDELKVQLADYAKAVKDLEEEMRSETPEHPWSFMKMRRHNRLHAEIEDERTSMSRDRYDLNRLTERLFEDVNIIADKATSTNSLELILDLVEQSLDTDPKYRENVRKQSRSDRWDVIHASRSARQSQRHAATHPMGQESRRGGISAASGPTARPTVETAAHARHGKLQEP